MKGHAESILVGAFYCNSTESNSFQEILDIIIEGLNLAASIGIQNFY